MLETWAGGPIWKTFYSRQTWSYQFRLCQNSFLMKKRPKYEIDLASLVSLFVFLWPNKSQNQRHSFGMTLKKHTWLTAERLLVFCVIHQYHKLNSQTARYLETLHATANKETWLNKCGIAPSAEPKADVQPLKWICGFNQNSMLPYYSNYSCSTLYFSVCLHPIMQCSWFGLPFLQ